MMAVAGTGPTCAKASQRCLGRGFSLLEVLVATAIFSIIAVAALSGVTALIDAREQLVKASERLAAVQRAVSGLERELTQTIARPVRGSGGAERPAVVGDTRSIEISHVAFPTALDPRGGRVRRTAWQFVDRRLERQRFATLDQADFGVRPDAVVVLDGIDSFRLRYLDQRREWSAIWPPRVGPDARPDALPLAVELRLEVDGVGPIRRLVQPVGDGET